jgi:hypothetical protein
MSAVGRSFFCLLLAFPVSAVAQPPQFIQITREEVQPLALARYGQLETEIARICAARKCPHPYLALQAQERPTEVWWLNVYDSQAEIERVPRAYARDRKLMAALLPLAKAKKKLARTTLSTVLRFSGGAADWRIGLDRFAVVFDEPARYGTCFRGRNDTFCFAAAPNENIARNMAKSAAAKVLKVSPGWSYPPPSSGKPAPIPRPRT